MTTDSAIPARLQARVDDLDNDELRDLREYIDELLGASQPSVADEIKAQVEDPSKITVKRDRPQSVLLAKRHRSPAASTDSLKDWALYRVTRERKPNGDRSLHWTFLGYID